MTIDEVQELQESYGGICTMCHTVVESGVEPDAEGYTCESCGAAAVMGIENAVIASVVEINGEEDA